MLHLMQLLMMQVELTSNLLVKSNFLKVFECLNCLVEIERFSYLPIILEGKSITFDMKFLQKNELNLKLIKFLVINHQSFKLKAIRKWANNVYIKLTNTKLFWPPSQAGLPSNIEQKRCRPWTFRTGTMM